MAVVASLALAGLAVAYSNSVTSSGQGTTADGLVAYDLKIEPLCTANGAVVDD